MNEPPPTLVCLYDFCGKPFVPARKFQRYCRPLCAQRRSTGVIIYTGTCNYGPCQNMYLSTKEKHMGFCSNRCINLIPYKEPEPLICEMCGETREVNPKKASKLCSECYLIRQRWRNYIREGGTDTFEEFVFNLRTHSKNGCEICGADVPLNYDHNHDTGKFRGMVCRNHNVGMGHFNDDPEELMKAVEYLRSRNGG